MTVPAIHERDVEELDLPGRRLRWLVSPDTLQANHCSGCVITVAPGERVRPAHSHPNGEEVIYILRGSGRVLVGKLKTDMSKNVALQYRVEGIPTVNLFKDCQPERLMQ